MIMTPETALTKLVESFDGALSFLDVAGENFGHAVLNIESAVENKTDDERNELLLLIENYVLMSGFLLDHPLLTVIRQIRDSTTVCESDTPVMALNDNIRPGQFWKHYKGGIYCIVSVAKNANQPYITDIHYASQDSVEVWALPVHEFIKTVNIDGETKPRFKYIGK